ncbi:MAG: DUF3592 domain-containing protein [Streptosporangiales bacterium]|nr:DUF3592 domain-containing protein [Streptosporangiales bacterium]
MEEFGDWFAVGAGVFCVLLGAYYLLKYWTFRQRAQRVPGTVVALTAEAGFGGAGRYERHPVLQFTTPEGREIRARMRFGSNPAIARVGDRVTVRYDPKNPEEAEIEGKGWLQPFLLFFLVVFGVVLIVLGVG